MEDVVRATPRTDAIVATIGASLIADLWHSNLECLELAIRNLHENEVQHMRGEGEVRWRLGSSTNSIIVEDTGPGVPEDELPNIGQRFVRGRNKSAIGGGPGLAIAAEALHRVGADLQLANRPDGPSFRAIIRLRNS
ncbi:ATP-binding protein [Rhodopseudomonas palustris]|uniref:ATP-binding protein n=1 Tax=Rhodopseudomonas palustris TaxID=1076 RepID=UPI0021F34E7A|nr:ATP-binding protein [Rhodopseudomonas palustris]